MLNGVAPLANRSRDGPRLRVSYYVYSSKAQIDEPIIEAVWRQSLHWHPCFFRVQSVASIFTSHG